MFALQNKSLDTQYRLPLQQLLSWSEAEDFSVLSSVKFSQTSLNFRRYGVEISTLGLFSLSPRFQDLLQQLSFPVAAYELLSLYLLELGVLGLGAASGSTKTAYRLYLGLNSRQSSKGVAIEWIPETDRFVVRYYSKIEPCVVKVIQGLATEASNGCQWGELHQQILVKTLVNLWYQGGKTWDLFQVTEDGNPRCSVDLGLYDTGICFLDIQSDLVALRELFSISKVLYDSWFDTAKHQILNRAAMGTDRKGNAFLTLYTLSMPLPNLVTWHG
ncbi:MAG: hypothetical protein F6K47_17595 [Symploca sp. SIO2E6]|nr:hypothetical protein [Symploca sp. SIO2E6]